MGSTHQTGPRVSDQKTGEVALLDVDRPEFADGDFSSDGTETTVTPVTLRTR